ncbi:MAG: hypothetical protein R3C53_26755 [Pirellulaceae bacterium]
MNQVALKNELRLFVSQTRTRLKSIAKVINHCKQLDQSTQGPRQTRSQPNAVETEMAPLTQACTKSDESTVETPVDNESNRRGAASLLAADACDVSRRLAAVKRRLAEQLENS